MNISLFFDHIVTASDATGKSIVDIAAKAKDKGLSAVDVNNTKFFVSGNQDFPALLRHLDLKLSSSFEFYDWGYGEFGKDVRIKEQIEYAANCGAKSILVVPGLLIEHSEIEEMNRVFDRNNSLLPGKFVSEFMQSNRAVMNMCEMLEMAVVYGKSCGVEVSIENFDDRCAPYSRSAGVLWFLSQIEGLKCTFDTGNFILGDESFEEAYPLYMDKICHIHAKDRGIDENICKLHNKGTLPTTVGSGYLNLQGAIKDFISRGYNGYIAIEQCNVKEPYNAIFEAIDFMKSI